jgi:hypothetical protein
MLWKARFSRPGADRHCATRSRTDEPFDITAYAESVDYEFTSKDYAVDFATLNIDAAWVKVNGESINQ